MSSTGHNPNANSALNGLLKSNFILEKNEDMIASIVENMQLGRIDNCLNQFSVLLDDMIGLSLEYDNFPTEDDIDEDFNAIISKFPDSLMRKNLFDNVCQEAMYVPTPPPIPPCAECVRNNVSNQLTNQYILTNM